MFRSGPFGSDSALRPSYRHAARPSVDTARLGSAVGTGRGHRPSVRGATCAVARPRRSVGGAPGCRARCRPSMDLRRARRSTGYAIRAEVRLRGSAGRRSCLRLRPAIAPMSSVRTRHPLRRWWREGRHVRNPTAARAGRIRDRETGCATDHASGARSRFLCKSRRPPDRSSRGHPRQTRP